jgi:hypothetical protein
MNNTFIYSILQYKHSLLLREAVNVGILFYFPTIDQFHFVSGNHQRVRAIYPEFDSPSYNSIIKSIELKLKNYSSLFANKFGKSSSLKEYIDNNLLNEDATVLQFSDPITSVDIYNEAKETVKKFSKLLLPGIVTEDETIIKHNENFLVNKYWGYILEKDRLAENKITRNKIITYNKIELQFDFLWHKATTNLVKPISFDLKQKQDIQNKSAQYFGYLTLLQPYAQQHNYRFDLLIGQPQEKELYGYYEDAVKRIRKAKSPKRIILENELLSYSEETAANLKQLE